jgi:hypothetical protein
MEPGLRTRVGFRPLRLASRQRQPLGSLSAPVHPIRVAECIETIKSFHFSLLRDQSLLEIQPAAGMRLERTVVGLLKTRREKASLAGHTPNNRQGNELVDRVVNVVVRSDPSPSDRTGAGETPAPPALRLPLPADAGLIR